MLQGRPREFVKSILVLTRVKFLFDRVTSTPYAIFYFFTTLLSCLILAALQGVILSDNTRAVNILAEVVDAAQAPPHITIMVDGKLHVCDHIPDRLDANCTVILDLNDESDPASVQVVEASLLGLKRRQVGGGIESDSNSEDDGFESEDDGVESDDEDSDDELEDDLEDGIPAPAPPPPPPSSTPPPPPPPSSTPPPPPPPPSSTPPPPPPPPPTTTSVASTTIVTTSSRSSSSFPATTSVLISITSTSTSSSSFTFTTSSSTLAPAPTSTDSSSTDSSSSTESTASSTSSTSSSSDASSTATSTETSSSSSSDVATVVAASTTSATRDQGATTTTSPRGTASSTRTTSTATVGTSGTPVARPTSGIVLNQSASSPHSMICIYSLSWLEDDLHDAQREDVATFFFQLWLFTVGLVAILNESLPHLGAALIGHILGGAWASSRISSTKEMGKIYREVIVPRACDNVDLLGSWWDLRLAHTIPLVVLNVLGVIALAFLSWKLLKIYAKSTFSRMGASPSIHNKYKLVLFFSVGLQLASFFTAASSGLWISKIVHGNYKMLVRHAALYLTAFVFIFAAVVPWLLLGWTSTRKESRLRFFLFLSISGLLIAISSAMFSSGMYRSIFKSWQLFAKVTVTAFVLLVVTVVAGIACFFNFNKGLKEHLHAAEALDGDDFTPVQFAVPPAGNTREYHGDSEKGGSPVPSPSRKPAPQLADLLQPPSNPRGAATSDSDSEKIETGYWEKIDLEQPPLTYSHSLSYAGMSPRPAIPVHLQIGASIPGSPASFTSTTTTSTFTGRPASSIRSFGLERRPTLPSSPRPGSIRSLERRPTLPSNPRPNSVRSVASSVSSAGSVTRGPMLPASPRPGWHQRAQSRFSDNTSARNTDTDTDSGIERGSSIRLSYVTDSSLGASAVSQAVPLPPVPAAFAQGAMPSPLPESLVNFPIVPGQVLEVPQRNRASLIESIMGMPSPAFTTSSKRTNLSHGTFGGKGGARF